MHPLLTTLEWRGVRVPIGSYGVLLVVALGVGSGLVLRDAARAREDVGAWIATLAGTVAVGFIGAYGLSTLTLWPQLGSLSEALARPGIVFYGGLAGGALGLCFWARMFGLPVLPALDRMIPGLPVGQALGRVGCFLGGCCHGAPSRLPWAVLGSHPWPLYEAAGTLLLAAWCGAAQRFAGAPGHRARAYVLGYAGLRAALEPLRGDRVRGVYLHGWVSSAQLISLLLLLVLGGAWILRARRPLREDMG